jgi:glycosyltransferase involved in cell wall biosynthesis
MSICAATVVFNEEARIETMLRCARWCDEIVVVDKSSTDRTREIARKYTNLVFEVPYSDYSASEIEKAFDCTTSEWICFLVASDLIHPYLARQIREMVDRSDFAYDVIHVPYRRYVLGLETKRSPWYSEVHPVVFRKKCVKIDYNSIHGPFLMDGVRHYKMPNSTKYCMYHLTHETVDGMMERHIRYCRIEGQITSKDISLWIVFKGLLRSVFEVLFKKKSLLLGWDGIALSLAYVMYSMLSFLYIWEKKKSKASEEYLNIRNNVFNEWEVFNRNGNHASI